MFVINIMTCNFSVGPTMGASVVRRLGHTTHRLHERTRIPAISALWMSTGWYVHFCHIEMSCTVELHLNILIIILKIRNLKSVGRGGGGSIDSQLRKVVGGEGGGGRSTANSDRIHQPTLREDPQCVDPGGCQSTANSERICTEC